jgi:hypothetical protein
MSRTEKVLVALIFAMLVATGVVVFLTYREHSMAHAINRKAAEAERRLAELPQRSEPVAGPIPKKGP